MNEKTKSVLDSVLKRFECGDIPDIISHSIFPIADNIPSYRWSLMNRLLMLISGTEDARGYKQWLGVNRYVKKGTKCIYILVPRIKKIEDIETGEERKALAGFMCQPVFRYEDTEGEPLEYKEIELPDLPLIEKAKEWGINVKAVPGNYSYLGSYSLKNKEIFLATPEEKIFFHELSHAAHERIGEVLKGGQDPFQEIIAELSAQVLYNIVGLKTEDTFGNSYRYIEKYANKLGMTPYTACIRVISKTEKVLNLILERNI